MAEHTLGRRIVERQPEVKIYGELHPLKAEVAILNSFSAHAGQDELVGYAQTMAKSRMKQTFIVHGERKASQAMQDHIRETFGWETIIPEQDDCVTLD